MSKNEFIDTRQGVSSSFDYLPGDGEILLALKDAFANGLRLPDVIEAAREATLPLDKGSRHKVIAAIRQEGLLAQWHAEKLQRQGDPAAADVRRLANAVSQVASMYGVAQPGVWRDHDEVELEISRSLHRSDKATEAHWTAFAQDNQAVHGIVHKVFGVPSTVEILPTLPVLRTAPQEKIEAGPNNKQRVVATVLATAFLSGLMPAMAQAASDKTPPKTPEVKSTTRPTAEATNPLDSSDPANLIAFSAPTRSRKTAPDTTPATPVSKQPVSTGEIEPASVNVSHDGPGGEAMVANTVLQETNDALSGLTPAPISVVTGPGVAAKPADSGTPEIAMPISGDKDSLGLVPAPINATPKLRDNAPGSGGTPEIAAPMTPVLPPVEIVPTPEPAPVPIPADKAPDAPAPTPAPKTPESPTASVPDIIIDPSLAGETQWSSSELAFIRDNIDMYTNIEKATGVEWEIIAALHYRETSLGMTNPANGQGLFQLYSSGEHFAPGPITKEEFTRQGILAANLLKDKTKIGAVYGELKLSDPDKVKDVLFSYNGRAHQYIKQSKDLGYSLPAEGSPYVMNLADDKRNSTKNPNWGQILTDNGPLGKANQKPGAWVQIEGLIKINKMAHDHTAADTPKTADAAPESPDTKEQFTGWTYPVPKGTPITSGFGPRGEGGKHDGEDFGAVTGTPFYAAAGGVAKVIVVDVRQGGWCQAALAPLGMNVSQVADPIQKEVHITSVINGHTYETIYAHLSEVDVAPNQIVGAGTQIGKTGGSGCSTGPHAHFEVRRDGVPIDPDIILDPAKWEAFQRGDIKVASVDETASTTEDTATATAVDESAAQKAVERAKRAVAAARAATEQVQREKQLVK